jgi:alpha-L-fucosidase 2
MGSTSIAAKHGIEFEGPAPNFFEGALMGNGGLGVAVTTRPDAICLHLAHNNVWDIRVQEKNQDKIGTFNYVFNKIKEISSNVKRLEDDPWYKEYSIITGENYHCKYPRPFPCGTLILFFDRRKAEVLGHYLDISTGLLTIKMLVENKEYYVKVIIDPEKDIVRIKCFEESCEEVDNVFYRSSIIPEEDKETKLPKYRTIIVNEQSLAFEQIMPFQIPEERDDRKIHPLDRKFSVKVIFNQRLDKHENLIKADLNCVKPLEASIYLAEGLASEKKFEVSDTPEDSFEMTVSRAALSWKRYWEKSEVKLQDEFLEKIWYRNNYFLNCVTRPEATCPGLFGNWMYKNIGTAWHGDYHFNYNIQQPFWGTFSSNHPEKHLSYVSLIEHVLPISKKWAKEYYGMNGAFYPHSAYPVKMNMMPYPVPTWGWEVCETPWAVQSLWWHYLYTGNKELLSERLFQPIKEAVSFLIDYMTRDDAHGPQWDDDKYHVFPTVVPELYELTPDFEMNSDCIVDLALIKFIFKAFIKACADLGLNKKEEELISQCQLILENYPEYARCKTANGEIFLNVKGENPEVVQNVPSSNCPVFPGEDIGIDSPENEYKVAVQTWKNHRNEGGNDLVFYNLQGARLGILDLERFKRQIKYSVLPNGVCNDRVLMSGGRYPDDCNFDFMMNMGIWVENFSLPAVINDCLLHGFSDTIRVFPNWPLNISASYRDLRAAGAFLISASCGNGKISSIEILSEKGGNFKMHNPWENGAVVNGKIIKNNIIELQTQPGEKLIFCPL